MYSFVIAHYPESPERHYFRGNNVGHAFSLMKANLGPLDPFDFYIVPECVTFWPEGKLIPVTLEELQNY